MKNGNGNRNEREANGTEWWRDLAAGEKAVIRVLMGCLRGLKSSEEREVLQAVAKYEACISCFLKTRLVNEWRRRRGRGKSCKLKC